MGPFAFILELLSRLPAALNATSRLVKATKDTEPPPPPVGGEGQADQYLRGRNEEKFDRLLRSDTLRLPEEPVKPEEPVDP